jgi:heptaprenyl diphosphate synthase
MVEAFVPRPLPWMRLGLGQLAVLLALLLFGGGEALAVSLVKLVIGSLFTGNLGGPAFVIGGGAGLASLAAMLLCHRAAPRLFSPVGLSVVGAVVHQTGQLVLAFVYIRQAGLWAFLPLGLVTGLVTGLLIGLLAHWVRTRLRAHGWPTPPSAG